MIQRTVSIVLSVLFILFLIMPTIIIMVDDTADVSIFYAVNEEEEKNSKEKNIDKELALYQYRIDTSNFDSLPIVNHLKYRIKRYSKPYITLVSPPPKLHFNS